MCYSWGGRDAAREECKREHDEREARAGISSASSAALAVLEVCETQWRHGFGGPTGLDYGGVEAGARLAGFELDADVFDRVRVLEIERLVMLQEARERDEKERARARGRR